MSDPVAEKEAGPPASTDTPPATEPRKRVYKDFEHDEEKPTRTCPFFHFFLTASREIFFLLILFSSTRIETRFPTRIHLQGLT